MLQPMPLSCIVNQGKRMWYRKNVGSRERLARLVAGALMVLCGLLWLQAAPLGLVIAGAGVVTVLTGLVGYCPACALVGRKAADDR